MVESSLIPDDDIEIDPEAKWQKIWQEEFQHILDND